MPATLTVFLLSGRPDLIEKAAQSSAVWASVDVRPFEEKTITSFSKTRHLLEAAASTAVAFGCKDLDLQRFQVALKFYLLVYGRGEGYLLDESGRVIPVTWGRFIVLDLVRFGVEVVVSAGVLIHAAIRLSGLSRQSEGRR